MLETQQSSVMGHIDVLDSGKLLGWIFNPDTPDKPVNFYVCLNDNIITQGVANLFRDDLKQAGFGTGHCSFSVSIDLPLHAMAGKTLTLIVEQGLPVVNTSYLIPADKQSVSIQFMACQPRQFQFTCHSLEDRELELTLYCNEQLITTKKIQVAVGETAFLITVPPQFSWLTAGFFRLAVNGFPCFVWGDYIELLPLVAGSTNVVKKNREQKGCINTNRLALLANKINTVAANSVDSTNVINAYHDLTLNRSNGFSFPSAAKPKVSIILPVNITDKLGKMLASLYLSMPNEDYEVLGLSNVLVGSYIDGHASHIVNVDVAEQAPLAEKIAALLSRAKSDYVVFCPRDCEFGIASIERLVDALEFEQVGFAAQRLVDDIGLLVNSSGLLSELSTTLTEPTDPICFASPERRYSANDSRKRFVKTIDFAIGTAAAYRKCDLLFQSIPPDCYSIEDVFFYWQTEFKQQGKLGLEVCETQDYCHVAPNVNKPLLSPINPDLLQLLYQQSVDLPTLSVVTGKAILGTVMMLDLQTPSPDQDAGSYAAIQELRLIQSLGYKVIFVPMNFVETDNYTAQLQSQGVEVCYAPYYPTLGDAICQRLPELSAIYITRYNVATHFIDFLKETAPNLPIIFNNADLHFLREIRSALAAQCSSEHTQQALANALNTKRLELDVIRKADAVLSYNETEHAVIASHVLRQDNIFKCPWVLDEKPLPASFESREGIAFLGGYRHLPNVEAVDFFMAEVFPLLIDNNPSVTVYFYGSNMPDSFKKYLHPQVKFIGYVADLDDVFQRHKVFIAPLLSGAGIKGKVLESAAYGLPSVLSPIAAESTGLSHNISTLIAETPQQWVEYIACLNTDNVLWKRLSSNQRILANEKYSFSQAQAKMRKVFTYLKMATC
ncbi:glycosyltransferase [Pseudoalteromonas sp. NCIMB_1079]|uniref:glycosyltransferase n=1 Tax=Pseudoalteromonas sp. NCIMB 1079 TaxID=3142847 RepID=UPI00339D2126